MSEIVLVTGGNGFLAQHLIALLLRESDNLNIAEVRTFDIEPYKNRIGHAESHKLNSFVGDICVAQSLKAPFAGVSTVFHCAALVSLQYPAHEQLEHVNVEGTRCIVEQCIQSNVERLVFTSCASVCMVPFKGSTFSIIINQTESKATTPTYEPPNLNKFENGFLIPAYAASKLRAENIVINSNGTLLSNKTDYLSTVALRPTLCYGECDERFVPSIYSYLRAHNFIYPRIAGSGGKQQVIYAGNVAWAHLCAYRTLKSTPKNIAGLPVFITDDTPINDVSRFVQKHALLGGKFKVNVSRWYVPHFLFYFVAYIVEYLLQLFGNRTKYRLPVSLRAIASFTASVLMFNRMRAEISMDYAPTIDADTAMQNSALWYAKWYDEKFSVAVNKSKNTTTFTTTTEQRKSS